MKTSQIWLRKFRRFIFGKYISELENQNKILRSTLKEQGYQIHEQQKIATYRNKQLSALHIVWCNGGCQGGIGCRENVDEALVLEAERNVKRIRQWWTNKQFKDEWKLMSDDKKAEWMRQAQARTKVT